MDKFQHITYLTLNKYLFYNKAVKSFPKNLLTKTEKSLFTKLKTPSQIQDFLNSLPYNKKDTVRSVRRFIESRETHCLEGAIFASAVLWYHGYEPLLLDLQTTKDDDDHVVALYKKDGLWGAISSTQHSVLRYRDPIYKNLRELALSYFNEYFLNSGKKTLRAFSKKPFSLLNYNKNSAGEIPYYWLFGNEELYEIGADLDDALHEKIAPEKNIRNLRDADEIEVRSSNL